MKTLIPVVTVLLFSQAFALLYSPEPEVDPFMRQKQVLFVTPAGRKTTPIVPVALREKNIICPKHYPTGFSVRCVVEPIPPKVIFRINGEEYRTEKYEPYYLAGEHEGVVNSFQTNRSFSVGCMVGRRNIWAVIKLKC